MFDSPFPVAIAAMFIPIVAIIAGVWSKAHSDRLKADQRMAMIARGHSLTEIEAVLKPDNEEVAKTNDPLRSLGRSRRTAVVLISVGMGLIAFFTVLTFTLREPDVFSGAAAGLIPLLIGLGFVVDYQLQKRELARFGLEVDADPRKN